MKDDNVIKLDGFRPERLDDVYICPFCEGQNWLLIETGMVKCDSCKYKGWPPERWVAAINKCNAD